MKNKKYLKAAISLGVGVVLLTVAVFANYDNASGYSACKKALKKVAFADNFSADYTIKLSIDDTVIENVYGSYKLNANGNPSLQTEETNASDYKTNFNKSTVQDDMRISQYDYNGSKDELKGFINNSYSKPAPIATEITNDAETGEKLVNFAESLADTLVGDLKNSIILSESGDVRTYSISLASEQLPSYVTSGVSLITSAIRKDNERYIGNSDETELNAFFGKGEPYIKNASAKISVDKEDNPVQFLVNILIAGYDSQGNEHLLTLIMSSDFYDFGTTVIDRIPDAELEKLDDYRHDTYPTAEVTSIYGEDGPTAVYVTSD